MSLEERIRQSVGLALDDMRARMESEVRAIAQELVASAAEERHLAVASARDESRAEADERLHAIERDAEARVRAATEATEARVRAELEALAAANPRPGECDTELGDLTPLIDAVRSLDAASSLSEVLDRLGEAAGRQSVRAALVVVRGGRVQGWRLSGFGALDAQPKSFDLGLADVGIIGTAAAGHGVVSTRDGGNAPAFAELPADRLGFAAPVVVGGRAVAVVYADTGLSREREVPGEWLEMTEILARHAGRCLEALTARRTVQAAPRFWVPSSAAPPSPPRSDGVPATPKTTTGLAVGGHA